jgi:YbbR domain-containing protein
MGSGGTRTLPQRVGASLTRDVGLKIISLIFAVSIWAWVQGKQVVEERTRARVSYSWPADLVPATVVPKTVVVTVRGPQGLLHQVDRSDLGIAIDLGESTKGPASVDFSDQPFSGLPAGLTVVQVSPPAMDIVMDRPLEREVPIRAVTAGDPPAGYRVVEVRIEPQRVELVGPQSILSNISEVSTDIIDVSTLTATRTFTVNLAIPDRTVDAGIHDTTQVTVQVETVNGERTFNDVPVMLRTPGWSASPGMAKVSFAGPVGALGSMDPQRIHLMLHLPNPLPSGNTVELSISAGTLTGGDAKDLPVQVVHPADGDLVHPLSVTPSTFILTRSP